MKKFYLISYLFFSLLFQSTVNAATITAAGSGKWKTPATWVGNAVPGAGDIAVIGSGKTVTVDPADYGAGPDVLFYWNNPTEIDVSGTLVFLSPGGGGSGQMDEILFTNPVTIKVFSPGVFLDNTAQGIYSFTDVSNLEVAAGAHFQLGTNNPFGDTQFFNKVDTANIFGSDIPDYDMVGATSGPFTMTTSSNTITFSPSTTLPLTLLSFTAQWQDPGVQLAWTTGTEQNL